MGRSTITMAIFNCYVSSPEGTILRMYDTLWLFNIARENDPIIDDVPINSDDFPWLC